MWLNEADEEILFTIIEFYIIFNFWLRKTFSWYANKHFWLKDDDLFTWFVVLSNIYNIRVK